MNVFDTAESRLLAAGARYAWLRAVYHQESTRRGIAENPEVRSDPELMGGRSQPPVDGPDFTIEGVGFDVVPDTEASRQGRADRGYLTSADQLMTYRVPTEEFLAEVFAP